ncbi:transglutaminase-like cysteine peptidase [Lentisphaera marina]|uniref:transglutaminase-like cysteine peptidase n=1 Tax=Lentisphaera marina TaxID=1111041 RepID=UPI002367185E|nr:transglutaminase-like cysteine peptidase [Lentisphaera marina]MDD7986321.1 transglutaminase-like cysteine peptidase [Lentisphaera marina]
MNSFNLKLSLLLMSLIVSCTTEPSLSQNWNYDRVPAHSELWEHRYQNAQDSILLEQKDLETSKRPELVWWRGMIKHLQNAEPIKQLEKVNFLVNKHIIYLSDYKHYQKTDAWGFPLETLTVGGDCEDIAFLKAITLLHLGWKEEDLTIVVGYYRKGQSMGYHAILEVKTENGGYELLDNTRPDIATPNQEHFFTPRYGIQKNKFFVYKEKK